MWREIVGKFCYLLVGGVVYLSLLIGLLYFFSIYGSGLLLLWMPMFIFVSSAVGLGVWLVKYRELFESLLVYSLYVCFGFAFIFLVPVAVERSLSTFVFFYAVEHDGIPQIKLSDGYKEAFFRKRFEDAVEGSFLTKEGNVYKPALRSKLYYHIFYPLGMITNTLGGYKKFEQEVEQNQREQK